MRSKDEDKIDKITAELSHNKRKIKECDKRLLKLARDYVANWSTYNPKYEEAYVRAIIDKDKKLISYFRKNTKHLILESAKEAFISQIILNFYELLLVWLKDPLPENAPPDIEDLFKQKKAELFKDEKEYAQQHFLGENLKKQAAAEDRDFFDSISHDSLVNYTASPTIEDKINNKLCKIIRKEFLIKREEIFKKLGILSLFQLSNTLARLPIKIARDYPDPIRLNVLSKEHKVNRRKLISTLKELNFPLLQIDDDLKSKYYILRKDQTLLEKHLPFIQIIWNKEARCKRWIKAFINCGKEKSNVSKIMKRKINRGVVPDYYFENVEPTKRLIRHVLRSKNNKVDLPVGIWGESQSKIVSKKDIENTLIKDISKNFADYWLGP